MKLGLPAAAAVVLLPLTGIVAFLSLPLPSAWSVFVLALAQHLALVWLRSRPTLVLCLIAAAVAAQAVVTGFFFLLPSNLLVLIAIHAAAAYGSRGAAVGVALFGSAAGAVRYALDHAVIDSGFGPAPGYLLVLFLAVTAVACSLGWMRRGQLAAAEAVRERDLQERRERERLAAVEERLRISRDLHDILAHSLAVVISQVRVARFEPEGAAAALAVVEETARTSLTELRSTLSELREESSDVRDKPAIDIAIRESVQDVADALGIRLAMTTRGTAQELHAEANSAVRWFVRESLTNAAKHAPLSRVDYEETWESDRLTISVRNDQPHPDSDAVHAGFGLRGMRERIAAVGGVLSVHPAPRFTVTARLPIRDDRRHPDARSAVTG